MRCPDCKKGELRFIDTMYLDYKDSVQKIAEPYYKCDVCKNEYSPDDVEE